MATVTNAVVRLQPSGQGLRADCFGNNLAVECPTCLQYPVLLVALPNQRGASPGNPSVCRHCGSEFFIADDVSPGQLEVVNVQRV
jgi:hypothetical protein